MGLHAARYFSGPSLCWRGCSYKWLLRLELLSGTVTVKRVAIVERKRSAVLSQVNLLDCRRLNWLQPKVVTTTGTAINGSVTVKRVATAARSRSEVTWHGKPLYYSHLDWLQLQTVGFTGTTNWNCYSEGRCNSCTKPLIGDMAGKAAELPAWLIDRLIYKRK